MKRITPLEVRERIAGGERFVFVDARNPQAYAGSREKIPDAIRIVSDAVDGNAGQVPRGTAVVAYCTCPAEKSSVKVAERLNQLGWKETYALQGGLDAWREAGNPLVGKEDVPAHAAP